MESQWNALNIITVKDFCKKAKDKDSWDKYIEELYKNYIIKHLYYGKEAGEPQKNSWKNSLFEMANVLTDDNIPSCCALIIEFKNIEDQTRADMVICGQSKDENSEIVNNVIVVELKQWSNDSEHSVERCDLKSEEYKKNKIKVDGKLEDHPSLQALNYKNSIEKSNHYIIKNKENIKLSSCAFMHNYFDDKEVTIIGKYHDLVLQSPLFHNHDKEDLFRYVYEKVKDSDEEKTAKLVNDITNSEIESMRIDKIFKEDSQFYLTYEQHVDYYEILTFIKDKLDDNNAYSLKDNEKAAVIVSGGPGTGKSAIALQLYKSLLDKGYPVQFITTTKPFGENIKALTSKALKDDDKIKDKYINNMHMADECSVKDEIIICDEANRLRNSESYQDQIKSLLKVGKIIVFFQDDDQLLFPDDYGSKENICNSCEDLKCLKILLEKQYRCDGGQKYLNWVDHVLQLRKFEKESLIWDNYDFKVFDSPKNMINKLRKNYKVNKSYDIRLLAGKTNYLKVNEQLNNFDFVKFDNTWASNPGERLSQNGKILKAGTVHDAQGMDFDYVGVFIGDDLTYDSENKKVISNNKTDNIKNIYKVLLTRGTKGCYVYCCDDNLRKHFKDCLKLIGK